MWLIRVLTSGPDALIVSKTCRGSARADGSASSIACKSPPRAARVNMWRTTPCAAIHLNRVFMAASLSLGRDIRARELFSCLAIRPVR